MNYSALMAGISPWISFDPDLWRSVTAHKTLQSYPKNALLYYQDSPAQFLYIVRSGRIRITSYQADGDEKHLYIAENGAICGEVACLQEENHSTSAVAIVDSKVFSVTRHEMLEALRKDWDLNQAFLALTFRKNAVLRQQVLELSFSSAESRVARVLLALAAQYGKEGDEGVQISIKFTNQDVANIVNASRVTINQTMNKMTSLRVIVRHEGYYVLKDMNELRRIADMHS